MSPPIQPSSLKVTIDKMEIVANVYTIQGLKQSPGYAKMLLHAPKNHQVFLNTLSKTADMFTSIGKSLDIYKDDSAKGIDVKKYTTVIFNNKAIVCKSKIHSLVLRVLGGRINKVGEKVNEYLESKAYTETRLDLAESLLKKNGRSDLQSFKNAIEGLISDYKTVESFKGVEPAKKQKMIDKFKAITEKLREIPDGVDEKKGTLLRIATEFTKYLEEKENQQ